MVLSILTATFNRCHLLKELAESIAQQRCPDWEWLIIDNGSTDKTKELIESYTPYFPEKIRYFRLDQNTGGPATAMQKFIPYLRGDLMYTVGDDDILLPEMVGTIIKTFEKDPALALVYGNYWMVMVEKGRVITECLQYPPDYQVIAGRCMTPAEFVRRMIGSRKTIAGHAAVFKRAVYEELGGFTTEYPRIIDQDFWFRLGTKYNFAYIPQPLVIARKFNTGANAARYEEGFDETVRYWRTVYEETTDANLKKALEGFFFYLEMRAITYHLRFSRNYKFFQKHAHRVVRCNNFWKRPRLYILPLLSFFPERVVFQLLAVKDKISRFLYAT